MTSRRTYRRAVAYLVFLTLIVSRAPMAGPVAAQDGVDASLRITYVDTGRFPDISLYLAGQDRSLQEEMDLTLLEDGIEQPLASSELMRSGTQVALVLDASESVQYQGETADVPRYVEVGNAVRRLVEKETLQSDIDWLTSMVAIAGGGSKTLWGWTRDYNAVSNSFYQFQPDSDVGTTSLYGLLSDALDSFESLSDQDPRASRSIVIFSDGVTDESEAWLREVLEQAEQMDVFIHTVLIGPGNNQTKERMQRMAQLSGGKYVHLIALEAVDEVWQRLEDDAYRRVLAYRSQTVSPGQLTVQVRLNNGSILDLSQPIPAISPPLAPAELGVQVVDPPGRKVIERSSQNPEAAISELEPGEMTLELQVIWPDEHPRNLTQVTLNYAEQSQALDVQSLQESSRFTVSIADLAQGSYELSLSAVDELGLTAESSLAFQIVENRPPLPTATTAPAPTATPLPTAPPAGAASGDITGWLQNGSWQILTVALGLLSLVLLLTLLFLLFALIKPDLRRQASVFLTGTLGAVTEPFLKGKSLPPSPLARLVLVSQGERALPAEIPLHSSNALIGREPSLVNVILRDRRVSRYHCRISQEADGTFRIWDEGSTSGTYVNQHQVGMSGQRLQPNDLVNIGPIQYRFELVGDERELRSPGPPDIGDRVDPEAYQPHQPDAGQEVLDQTELFVPDGGEPYQPDAVQPPLDKTEVFVPGGAEPYPPDTDQVAQDHTQVYEPGGTEPDQPDADREPQDDTQVYEPGGTEPYLPDADQAADGIDVYEADGKETLHAETIHPQPVDRVAEDVDAGSTSAPSGPSSETDDWMEIEEDTNS